MSNILPPNRDIHEEYDLKGSFIGREVPEEQAKSPGVTLKDLNWVKRNMRLIFGTEKAGLFLDQLRKDVALLSRLNIMDYSLLIGIHDMNRGNRDNIRDATLSVFEVRFTTSSWDKTILCANCNALLPAQSGKT